MTATRERSINLRDWEVRAIQAGRLKMLVRPVKPQPVSPGDGAYFDAYNGGPEWTWWTPDNRQYLSQIIRCPYGKPGDRLRGREAWRAKSWSEEGWGEIEYRADGRAATVEGPWSFTKMYPFDMLPHVWRSSVYMPRFAVRSWLEITEVRCGLARDMSQHDAESAGADCDSVEVRDGGPEWSQDAVWVDDYVSPFEAQYDADYGEGAWEGDWVWMIGVKRIEGGK